MRSINHFEEVLFFKKQFFILENRPVLILMTFRDWVHERVLQISAQNGLPSLKHQKSIELSIFDAAFWATGSEKFNLRLGPRELYRIIFLNGQTPASFVYFNCKAFYDNDSTNWAFNRNFSISLTSCVHFPGLSQQTGGNPGWVGVLAIQDGPMVIFHLVLSCSWFMKGSVMCVQK